MFQKYFFKARYRFILQDEPANIKEIKTFVVNLHVYFD